MTEDRVESHATIPAPARVVWALLTEPEHLGSWFSDAGAQVDLRPGGTITISWKESGTARCVVERIQPERELTWRWAPTHDHGTGILEVRSTRWQDSRPKTATPPSSSSALARTWASPRCTSWRAASRASIPDACAEGAGATLLRGGEFS